MRRGRGKSRHRHEHTPTQAFPCRSIGSRGRARQWCATWERTAGRSFQKQRARKGKPDDELIHLNNKSLHSQQPLRATSIHLPSEASCELSTGEAAGEKKKGQAYPDDAIEANSEVCFLNGPVLQEGESPRRVDVHMNDLDKKKKLQTSGNN